MECKDGKMLDPRENSPARIIAHMQHSWSQPVGDRTLIALMGASHGKVVGVASGLQGDKSPSTVALFRDRRPARRQASPIRQPERRLRGPPVLPLTQLATRNPQYDCGVLVCIPAALTGSSLLPHRTRREIWAALNSDALRVGESDWGKYGAAPEWKKKVGGGGKSGDHSHMRIPGSPWWQTQLARDPRRALSQWLELAWIILGITCRIIHTCFEPENCEEMHGFISADVGVPQIRATSQVCPTSPSPAPGSLAGRTLDARIHPLRPQSQPVSSGIWLEDGVGAGDATPIRQFNHPARRANKTLFRACAGVQERGETGNPRENPPTSGIFIHDSHVRKSRSDPTGNRARFSSVGGEQSNHWTTATPSRGTTHRPKTGRKVSRPRVEYPVGVAETTGHDLPRLMRNCAPPSGRSMWTGKCRAYCQVLVSEPICNTAAEGSDKRKTTASVLTHGDSPLLVRCLHPSLVGEVALLGGFPPPTLGNSLNWWLANVDNPAIPCASSWPLGWIRVSASRKGLLRQIEVAWNVGGPVDAHSHGSSEEQHIVMVTVERCGGLETVALTNVVWAGLIRTWRSLSPASQTSGEPTSVMGKEGGEGVTPEQAYRQPPLDLSPSLSKRFKHSALPSQAEHSGIFVHDSAQKKEQKLSEHLHKREDRINYSPPTYSRWSHSRVFACGNRAGRSRWLASFLGDLPSHPLLHSGAAPYSPRFTFIGSQYLDVKSHTNLFTHSSTPLKVLRTTAGNWTNSVLEEKAHNSTREAFCPEAIRIKSSANNAYVSYSTGNKTARAYSPQVNVTKTHIRKGVFKVDPTMQLRKGGEVTQISLHYHTLFRRHLTREPTPTRTAISQGKIEEVTPIPLLTSSHLPSHKPPEVSRVLDSEEATSNLPKCPLCLSYSNNQPTNYSTPPAKEGGEVVQPIPAHLRGGVEGVYTSRGGVRGGLKEVHTFCEMALKPFLHEWSRITLLPLLMMGWTRPSRVKKRESDTGDTKRARLAPHRPYAQGVQCFRRDADEEGLLRKSLSSRLVTHLWTGVAQRCLASCVLLGVAGAPGRPRLSPDSFARAELRPRLFPDSFARAELQLPAIASASARTDYCNPTCRFFFPSNGSVFAVLLVAAPRGGDNGGGESETVGTGGESETVGTGGESETVGTRRVVDSWHLAATNAFQKVLDSLRYCETANRPRKDKRMNRCSRVPRRREFDESVVNDGERTSALDKSADNGEYRQGGTTVSRSRSGSSMISLAPADLNRSVRNGRVRISLAANRNLACVNSRGELATARTDRESGRISAVRRKYL
ncbi:hypothetical protein PR048_007572 [Dryococelus australis]|uniref:Uncharacterized protein n=1 Tax=Dryococelus australis TaxID=614101 RepID=A0ABQ9HVJ5_9NEOP|nr:hypothetical protein PR048_007572 [Dryococelus australis]